MARKPRSDWEKAARALCSFDGIPENIVRDGKPMWTQYLAEARAVLIAIDRFYPEDGKGLEGNRQE
jgi:hypothetical protein